ncbi:MAG: hypothetical protein WAU36_04125 [Cyclobacteriaceae bacterium]
MHSLLIKSIERFTKASDQEKEMLVADLKVQSQLDPEEIRDRYLMSKREFLNLIKELKEYMK